MTCCSDEMMCNIVLKIFLCVFLHVPGTGILREFLFTGSRIGFYDPVLRLFKELSGTTHQPCTAGEMFFVGQSVGALSGALVNPVEVLKIR
jgi:hypothetical protein